MALYRAANNGVRTLTSNCVLVCVNGCSIVGPAACLVVTSRVHCVVALRGENVILYTQNLFVYHHLI